MLRSAHGRSGASCLCNVKLEEGMLVRFTCLTSTAKPFSVTVFRATVTICGEAC